MDKNKAIELLRDQIEKLNHPVSDLVWKTQTLSLISEFFSEFSEEYQYLRKFRFSWAWDNDARDKIEPADKKTLTQFIEGCIKTIERKGLSETSKTDTRKLNFIQRIDNPTFVTIIIFVVSAIFLGGVQWGKKLSDVQNIKLEQEIEDLQEKNTVLEEQLIELQERLLGKDSLATSN